MQYASLFHDVLNIFAQMKHNILLRKTAQCERDFIRERRVEIC